MVTFCLLDALLCEATYPLPCNRRRDYRHLLTGCRAKQCATVDTATSRNKPVHFFFS